MKEKKARVEDALHATRAAVEEASCLVVAWLCCPRATLAPSRATTRPRRWHQAGAQGHRSPLREIVANAGGEPSVVVNAVLNGSGNYGFNAANDTYGDMIEMGILDPTKVTRTGAAERRFRGCSDADHRVHDLGIAYDDAPAGGMPDMGGMGGMDGMGM